MIPAEPLCESILLEKPMLLKVTERLKAACQNLCQIFVKYKLLRIIIYLVMLAKKYQLSIRLAKNILAKKSTSFKSTSHEIHQSRNPLAIKIIAIKSTSFQLLAKKDMLKNYQLRYHQTVLVTLRGWVDHSGHAPPIFNWLRPP